MRGRGKIAMNLTSKTMKTRGGVKPLSRSKYSNPPPRHRWESPGNYPVFTAVMVIYHYVERIWRILVSPFFCITYMIINRHYTGRRDSIHIQSVINIIQVNNWVITTKKR